MGNFLKHIAIIFALYFAQIPSAHSATKDEGNNGSEKGSTTTQSSSGQNFNVTDAVSNESSVTESKPPDGYSTVPQTWSTTGAIAVTSSKDSTLQPSSQAYGGTSFDSADNNATSSGTTNAPPDVSSSTFFLSSTQSSVYGNSSLVTGDSATTETFNDDSSGGTVDPLRKFSSPLVETGNSTAVNDILPQDSVTNHDLLNNATATPESSSSADTFSVDETSSTHGNESTKTSDISTFTVSSHYTIAADTIENSTILPVESTSPYDNSSVSGDVDSVNPRSSSSILVVTADLTFVGNGTTPQPGEEGNNDTTPNVVIVSQTVESTQDLNTTDIEGPESTGGNTTISVEVTPAPPPDSVTDESYNGTATTPNSSIPTQISESPIDENSNSTDMPNALSNSTEFPSNTDNTESVPQVATGTNTTENSVNEFNVTDSATDSSVGNVTENVAESSARSVNATDIPTTESRFSNTSGDLDLRAETPDLTQNTTESSIASNSTAETIGEVSDNSEGYPNGTDELTTEANNVTGSSSYSVNETVSGNTTILSDDAISSSTESTFINATEIVSSNSTETSYSPLNQTESQNIDSDSSQNSTTTDELVTMDPTSLLNQTETTNEYSNSTDNGFTDTPRNNATTEEGYRNATIPFGESGFNGTTDGPSLNSTDSSAVGNSTADTRAENITTSPEETWNATSVEGDYDNTTASNAVTISDNTTDSTLLVNSTTSEGTVANTTDLSVENATTEYDLGNSTTEISVSNSTTTNDLSNSAGITETNNSTEIPETNNSTIYELNNSTMNPESTNSTVIYEMSNSTMTDESNNSTTTSEFSNSTIMSETSNSTAIPESSNFTATYEFINSTMTSESSNSTVTYESNNSTTTSEISNSTIISETSNSTIESESSNATTISDFSNSTITPESSNSTTGYESTNSTIDPEIIESNTTDPMNATESVSSISSTTVYPDSNNTTDNDSSQMTNSTEQPISTTNLVNNNNSTEDPMPKTTEVPSTSSNATNEPNATLPIIYSTVDVTSSATSDAVTETSLGTEMSISTTPTWVPISVTDSSTPAVSVSTGQTTLSSPPKVTKAWSLHITDVPWEADYASPDSAKSIQLRKEISAAMTALFKEAMGNDAFGSVKINTFSEGSVKIDGEVFANAETEKLKEKVYEILKKNGEKLGNHTVDLSTVYIGGESAAPLNQPGSDEGKGMSGGAVGAVVAIVIIIAVLAVIGLICRSGQQSGSYNVAKQQLQKAGYVRELFQQKRSQSERLRDDEYMIDDDAFAMSEIGNGKPDDRNWPRNGTRTNAGYQPGSSGAEPTVVQTNEKTGASTNGLNRFPIDGNGFL